MTDYREKVVRSIRERTGEPLMNGSINDAAIITQEILANANSRVRILANRLSADCYTREQLRAAAKYFLADPDHRLEILVEASMWDTNNNFEWKNHPLVEDLLQFAGGDQPRFSLKGVPLEWTQRYQFNFSLLDDFGYRFEADRARPAAVAVFFPEGQTAPVQRLNGIFDLLWSASQELPLH